MPLGECVEGDLPTVSWSLKHKAIQRRTNTFGYTVLFTNTQFTASNILKIYREKVKLILSLRRAHHSSQKDTIARLNLLIMDGTNYFNHTQASGTYHTLQAFLNWKLEKYYRRKHKIPRSHTHIVYDSLPKLGAIPLSGRISYVYP